MMKRFTIWHFFAIILILVFFDQFLKIYVKTHFFLGEEKLLIGDIFRIHFIENAGMAFGWTLWGGSEVAKISLTLLRLVIIVGSIFYMIYIIKRNTHFWFLFSWTLVIAGAIGNLTDSLFYGLIFNESGNVFVPRLATIFPEEGGYAGFFQGKVVDMFYCPIIQTTLPDWFPIWGGEYFEFFKPVFNLADSYISIGIVLIFIFYNIIYGRDKRKGNNAIVSND